ncbi:MAG TPA: PEP/pyruvate-binding domain-containing protein [Micromonosporaceae bacterium]
MKLVAPLSAVGRGDLILAGGKGANLGELIRAGFPVPPGFVITTDAYRMIVRSLDLDIAEQTDGAATRAAFEAVTVPDRLRTAIVRAYFEMGGGPVAVRSSATAEDLPGATFAGQQDTYLNVLGEPALLEAVRRCWGSLWTDRAIAYREKRGIATGEISMAVVVQTMVNAEYAGVMFTANPVTGNPDQFVVDASPGLGEAVVSGLVTPDHYVLDKRGRVREWSPGRREVVITGTAGGGVRHETGDPATAERLPDAALERLALLGNDVARHFGTPQDIEWTWVSGRVSLVQARPMTALPPPPVRLGRLQRQLGSVLLEYLPVRPYPIDMSTWIPHGPAGLMARVVAHFGIRGAFEDLLSERDGVVEAFVPPSPRPSWGMLRAPYRIASLARRHDPARWTEDPRFTDFLAQVREAAGEDLATMPWPRLVRVPRQALSLVDPITELRIGYLPRTGLALLRLLLTLALLRRTARFGDLILGAHTRTTDANRELEALASLVRKNPDLTEAVNALDLDRLKEFDEFHAAFQAFLAEYGHRETVTPILVTPPTWGEAPETVLGLVKVLAAAPPKPVDPAGAAMRELLSHPWLRSAKRRARITRWVQAAREGIAFREDSHFYFTLPLPILRRSLLEIGRRLRDVGVLQEPEDVFHLRLEELEAISDVAGLREADRHRLRSLVRARSTRRDELAGIRLIDPSLVFPTRRHGDALVSGTPAGGGMVTGPVKVIREPAEFSKLDGGDVLVCPYTNPSWTPLFQRAVAVVVDVGGTGSHAAIVAREYGIPAVMGTAVGTDVLTDGQVVTVDGDTGRVSAAGS